MGQFAKINLTNVSINNPPSDCSACLFFYFSSWVDISYSVGSGGGEYPVCARTALKSRERTARCQCSALLSSRNTSRRIPDGTGEAALLQTHN